MSYRIKGKNGLPIKKDGHFLMGYDIPATKIEQLNEHEMSFLAVGSTEDEDRDKDIVRVAGWKLENFKNNPVLPWSHNYWEPPVGKAVNIKKDNTKKKLIFKAQFDKEDDKARLIFNKYKNGFLNTFSVGFIGLEFNFRDEENQWYGGKEFVKQELLEISPVTVPANPNANMDIRGMGDDLPNNLVQMGFKQFTCKTSSGLFVPVNDAELFTSPCTILMADGVKGVYASFIDTPEAQEKEFVGYLFGDSFSETDANNWIGEKGIEKQKTGRSKYFDMGEAKLGDSDFDLEIVEEVKTVDENNTDENNSQEETTEETVEDDFDGGGAGEEEEKPVEESEEETDDKAKNIQITLNKEQLDYIVDEVKKLVVKEEEIDNNDDSVSTVDGAEETDESKNDDDIEFDDSLFSPVNEEEDSENIIEIDEKVFEDARKQIKGNKDSFSGVKDALEKTIKRVMGDFSGKLED